MRLGCYLLCNIVILHCNNFVPGSAEVAEMVFNLCVKEDGHRGDADYEITLNYEFLEDIYSDWSENNDGAALETSSQMNFSMDDSLEVDGCKELGKAAVEKAVQQLERRENHPLMIMVSPLDGPASGVNSGRTLSVRISANEILICVVNKRTDR